MGTNYYHRTKICQCCGRYEERHIGKSSYGWCFSLRIYPEDGIRNLDDWKGIFALRESEIFDEYGQKVGIRTMLSIIQDRDHPEESNWIQKDYRDNHAPPGPKNLVRHKLDGTHCVGHGEGTWDYIVGDFF